jgi:diadenosine tetraphosphatase ApaH/serine/threonine PP2A family protein phosphatase
MRYAVLSDIHGNLEALTAVLDRIAGLRAGRFLCLGDIVGYNANPNECIDIVRSEKMAGVLGNHDAAACGLSEPDNFNPLARQALLWTRTQLSPESRAFLQGLPREFSMPGLFLCHGAIHDTDRYLLSMDDVRETFSLMTELPGSPRACFHGHTHVKMAFSVQEGTSLREPNDSFLLDRGRRYLINPGAVGQPRDGDPRAAFLVYDSEERRVSFHRVGYDIAACQDKIIRAGLPPRLAERLAMGW